MSAEELRQFQEYISMSQGIRNINCGFLRRIGKTHCLISMIQMTNPPVFLFVPTREMASAYNNIRSNIDRICVIQTPVTYATYQELCNLTRSVSRDSLINAYSDEIPGFEDAIMRNPHYNYIAGFYSIPYRQPPRPVFRMPENTTLEQLRQELLSSAPEPIMIKPEFFEMSWVANPAPSEQKKVKKTRMEFIFGEN